jgi:hypothetical protein
LSVSTAVEPDQLAGAGSLDVTLGLGKGRLSLIAGGVAGDQGEPTRPRVEAVATQAAPDAVG